MEEPLRCGSRAGHESSLKYSGKAYGPEETTIAYADIKPDEVDPCSLVLPANTWRLPTTEEFLNLTKGGSKEWKTESYRMCSDGEQNVYLAASGQLNKTGTGVSLPKEYLYGLEMPGRRRITASSCSGTSPQRRQRQKLQTMV